MIQKTIKMPEHIQQKAEYVCSFLYHNFDKLFNKTAPFNLEEICLDLEIINDYVEESLKKRLEEQRKKGK